MGPRTSGEDPLVGKRVRLTHMNDQNAPPPGTEGTVTSVDAMGTVHVSWDNGSNLGLIPLEDRWKVL